MIVTDAFMTGSLEDTEAENITLSRHYNKQNRKKVV